MPKDVKYYDMGYKRRRPDIASEVEDTTTKVYPGSTISDKQAPFLKGLKPGDTFEISQKCRVTGIREAEEWDEMKEANYISYDIQKIAEYK